MADGLAMSTGGVPGTTGLDVLALVRQYVNVRPTAARLPLAFESMGLLIDFVDRDTDGLSPGRALAFAA